MQDSGAVRLHDAVPVAGEQGGGVVRERAVQAPDGGEGGAELGPVRG